MNRELPSRRAEKGGERMKHSLCAFNVSRQSFINLGVAVADTPLTRLRGLLGKMRLRSDEALWVVPSRGIHTIGLLFPIDLIYLDAQLRVIHVIEHLGPLRIAPVRWQLRKRPGVAGPEHLRFGHSGGRSVIDLLA